MKSNVERLFDNYYNGEYNYKKSDKLRLGDNAVIYDRGTPIGYIVGDEWCDGYIEFLVLSNQDFRLDSSWKKHKKDLANMANKFGMYVIFVPAIDMGFGIENRYASSMKALCKDLINIAKYSQDEEIKTACCGVKYDKVIAYSYNQKINDRFVHAEKVLRLYLLSIYKDIQDVKTYYSLLEPCEDCLNNMISEGAEEIYYGHCHKKKWDTPNYIQLTNDIWNKSKVSVRLKPIIYDKSSTPEIEKFYSKGDKK